MTHPVVYIPLLTTNPVGWAILGVAGYLTYKAGKKVGKHGADDVAQVGLVDQTVKGAMKSAYKAKIQIGKSLSNTREKYSEMWSEAQTEAVGKS